MELRSEARAVGVAGLAAGAAFGGVFAALYGFMALLIGGTALGSLVASAVLVAAFAVAPALSVYLVVGLVRRLLGGDERGLVGAAGAFLGGSLGLAGSYVVNGLFLFVGWYLFPWTFAYAAMILPHLLRRRSARAGTVALHAGAATGVYGPWIALTLYNALDQTAERAGGREGSGWIENFPSAVVLCLLYAAVVIAAVAATRSPGPGRQGTTPAPSDRSPIP